MKIAQAESADSVSNILLKIYSEQCPSADSVLNILLKIYSENCPSWKCRLCFKHFTKDLIHMNNAQVQTLS
jgi:transposase-like protein